MEFYLNSIFDTVVNWFLYQTEEHLTRRPFSAAEAINGPVGCCTTES